MAPGIQVSIFLSHIRSNRYQQFPEEIVEVRILPVSELPIILILSISGLGVPASSETDHLLALELEKTFGTGFDIQQSIMSPFKICIK